MSGTRIIFLLCMFASQWFACIADWEKGDQEYPSDRKLEDRIEGEAPRSILHNVKGFFEWLLNPDEEPDFSSISFNLYTPEGTFQNPGRFDLNVSAEDLLRMNFSSVRPTKVLAHGLSNGKKTSFHNLPKAYLRNPDLKNLNIITFDWGELAHRSNYATAADNAAKVGNHLGKLFGRLLIRDLKASPTDIHLIGFSLGAHLVGNMGRAMEAEAGQGKVGRVTGLDAAKPLFNWANADDIIRPEDGTIVDIFHTNGGWLLEGGLAFRKPLGTIDFYFNGGTYQPGCNQCLGEGFFCRLQNIIFNQDNYCNHARSVHFYMATLEPENNGTYFESYPCEMERNQVEAGSCKEEENCLHAGERMEMDRAKKMRGTSFCLETTAVPPYTKS